MWVNIHASFPTDGGRGKTISASRPTMIVSVWCRKCDQRQNVALRASRKLAG